MNELILSDSVRIFHSCLAMFLGVVCLTTIAITNSKNLIQDWRWGWLPPKRKRGDLRRNFPSRISSEFRLMFLNLIVAIGLATLWIVDIEFINPGVIGLTTLTFGIMTLIWGKHTFFCSKRKNDYRRKTRWSWIPLPQWDRAGHRWNIRVHYYLAAIVLVVSSILNTIIWVWSTYADSWVTYFATWSVWQTVAVNSWIALTIVATFHFHSLRHRRTVKKWAMHRLQENNIELAQGLTDLQTELTKTLEKSGVLEDSLIRNTLDLTEALGNAMFVSDELISVYETVRRSRPRAIPSKDAGPISSKLMTVLRILNPDADKLGNMLREAMPKKHK